MVKPTFPLHAASAAGPRLYLAPQPSLQPLADIGGAVVQPNDGVVQRQPRCPVPHQRGLSLVGDADRLDGQGPVLGRGSRHALAHALLDAVPYHKRVVIAPPAGMVRARRSADRKPTSCCMQSGQRAYLLPNVLPCSMFVPSLPQMMQKIYHMFKKNRQASAAYQRFYIGIKYANVRHHHLAWKSMVKAC